MKVAALDLGSNTFLCLICEVENGKITQIYHDEVEMVRLGQGFGHSDEKSFHPDALQRADQCLNKFKKAIDQHRPEKVLAMATSAARDAKNKSELFRIGNNYQIPIEVIPGHLEAQITYQGSVSGLKNPESILVVDIGGGSTEFVFGQKKEIQKARSYDIGCVRLTEKFIHQQPTPTDQVENAEKAIKSSILDFKNTLSDAKDFEILAVAGTPTALVVAEIGEFSTQKIDGFKLSTEKLSEWKNRLVNSTVEQKIDMGIPNGRADVILIGVLTLLEVLKVFGKNDLMVSTRGVRHGVALEMVRRFRA